MSLNFGLNQIAMEVIRISIGFVGRYSPTKAAGHHARYLEPPAPP